MHYYELLPISAPDKRSFYEKNAVNSGWSVRELKRQIDSSLFMRLLRYQGAANRSLMLALALKGNEITVPAYIIRDHYVVEFPGLSKDKSMILWG